MTKLYLEKRTAMSPWVSIGQGDIITIAGRRFDGGRTQKVVVREVMSDGAVVVDPTPKKPHHPAFSNA
jgi:hypothetical protein